MRPGSVGARMTADGPSSHLPGHAFDEARAHQARAAAHELNNLLNGIGMVIHEARDPQRTPSELRAALSDIATFLGRGEEIVTTLRKVARAGGSDGTAESGLEGDSS